MCSSLSPRLGVNSPGNGRQWDPILCRVDTLHWAMGMFVLLPWQQSGSASLFGLGLGAGGEVGERKREREEEGM